MRSETYMSKIRPNLQRGKLTVENRKSREKKTDMLRSIGKQSGESVKSVSFASFIIIFIIEDIFRVAYAVKNYCKYHCSGEELMTRKKKCHSTSNSFVSAAEQVCFQPVLEHRQRRGRRNNSDTLRLLRKNRHHTKSGVL